MSRKLPVQGLRAGGDALWNQVMDNYELGRHEEVLLMQACRILDLLDRLQLVIDSEDVVVSSPQGLKANPAVVEFRQQAVTFAKCMASLRIPVDVDQSAGRLPQQRVGVRRASLSATK